MGRHPCSECYQEGWDYTLHYCDSNECPSYGNGVDICPDCFDGNECGTCDGTFCAECVEDVHCEDCGIKVCSSACMEMITRVSYPCGHAVCVVDRPKDCPTCKNEATQKAEAEIVAHDRLLLDSIFPQLKSSELKSACQTWMSKWDAVTAASDKKRKRVEVVVLD